MSNHFTVVENQVISGLLSPAMTQRFAPHRKMPKKGTQMTLFVKMAETGRTSAISLPLGSSISQLREKIFLRNP